MFRIRAHKTVSWWAAVWVCLAVAGSPRAATFAKLPGSISGIVRDSVGMPKMGAVVQLFNRQQRLLLRATTNERGQFGFGDLIPDLYAVRVTRIPYDPAIRKDITVRPGERSVLTVSLSNLFSSIQIAYPTLENGSPMTDEWKWVLRSAPATRPVFRYAPDGTDAAAPASSTDALAQPDSQQAQQVQRAAMFSDMRGIVRLSAGDGGLSAGVGNQADLGTTFALASALYGTGVLQVSGNVGYGAQTGVPAAAFRTSYSRNLAGGTPQLSLTMRQLLLPERLAGAFSGADTAIPMLRTMSASIDDHMQLSDQLTLQYGSTLDSVSFVDHLNYISPYARLTYQISPDQSVDFAFTSGNARTDLAGTGAEDADLQRSLDTLSLFPRVSLLGGQPKVQRGEEYEVGYSQKSGSRTYHLSAYHESVINAALTMVAPYGMFGGADVMPDLFSANSIFNAGNFQSSGYSASVTQALGDNVNASAIFGSTGGLTTDGHELVSNNPDELRAMIHMGRRNAATARVVARIPHAGTHLTASYQWSGDRRWAMAGNLYSTEAVRPVPGLNVVIRQPLPGFAHRVEATAELRNMLAQGYLPLYTSDGQCILLVENPRTFKGGLNFIF
jgi:hypothetical protein